MTSLTPTQEKTLRIVRELIAIYGYSPSTEEIMFAGGWRSTASVSVHLHQLRRLGYITYDSNKNRTIRIVRDA